MLAILGLGVGVYGFGVRSCLEVWDEGGVWG